MSRTNSGSWEVPDEIDMSSNPNKVIRTALNQSLVEVTEEEQDIWGPGDRATAGYSHLTPEEHQAKKGLSNKEAVLAFISTIIGGGIVGIPFSMYHAGIPVGVILNTLVVISSYFAAKLYLKAS